MKDILMAVVEQIGMQALAVQAIGDHVTALKTTLIFHYPEIEDDLKAQIEVERKKSQESVLLLQTNLAKLRELVSRLPD
jgi:hypothetical protein